MRTSHKILILILLFVASKLSASIDKANKYYQKNKTKEKYDIAIMSNLYKKKLYFSAAHYSRKHLLSDHKIKKNIEYLDHMLEKLILRTGTIAFVDLPVSALTKYPSKSLNFILGLKYFKQARYKNAIKTLEKLGEEHRFSPEALFITGTSLSLQNKYEKAIKVYRNCFLSARLLSEQAKDDRLKRYYTILKESCVIHQARLEYKRGNFQLAQKMYKHIPTKSYRWPYIILEQAWAAYVNTDYNRSLGLLVTYKSPLLESYFMPEAAVLRALNYLKLCLWHDSLQVIHEYYQTYKKHSDALKKMILPHKQSHTYFVNLVNNKDKSSIKNPFIRNLTTQIKKKIKYNIELHQYKSIKKEIKAVKAYRKQKDSELLKYLTKRLQREKNWRLKKINHFAKKEMFRFLNEMHKNSFEMVNVKLEILFLQRDLIYDDKKLTSTRARGSHDNVKRQDDQHFYTFRGAFWADELGDYSFGLKSNCKRQESQNAK